MEHTETLSQGRHKVGDAGKDFEVGLLQTSFIIKYFGSNWASIAIGNAWRLIVLKVWGIMTLDWFLIQNFAEIQSVDALIGKVYFQEWDIFLFPYYHLSWQLWKAGLRKYQKIYPEVDVQVMQHQQNVKSW